jgi:hypothetical protein
MLGLGHDRSGLEGSCLGAIEVDTDKLTVFNTPDSTHIDAFNVST